MKHRSQKLGASIQKRGKDRRGAAADGTRIKHGFGQWRIDRKRTQRKGRKGSEIYPAGCGQKSGAGWEKAGRRKPGTGKRRLRMMVSSRIKAWFPASSRLFPPFPTSIFFDKEAMKAGNRQAATDEGE